MKETLGPAAGSPGEPGSHAAHGPLLLPRGGRSADSHAHLLGLNESRETVWRNILRVPAFLRCTRLGRPLVRVFGKAEARQTCSDE